MKKYLVLSLALALSIIAVAPAASTSAIDPIVGPGVADIPAISSVTAGTQHTCIVRNNTVWCTGSNSKGQLGTGGSLRTISFSPSLMTDAVSVSAGGNTTCAVRTDATVWCWGTLSASLDPLLAPPRMITTDVLSPVQIPLAGVRTVAVGSRHSCATLLDDTAWCWGSNTWGQLGDGTQNDSLVPVRAVIDRVQSLDVGTEHTCAVRRTNSVWCWGSNGYHRLGLRASTPRLVPTYIPRVRATTVATGSAFTCITSLTERVLCWGRNQYGQLGRTAGPSRIAPHITSVKRPVSLTAGEEFACAVTAARTTWCWGRNRYSQLANGSVYAKSRPQKIIASNQTGPISSVGTGDSHACGIASIGGSMWCWGLSLQGQLGDGGSSTRPRGTAIWPNGVSLKSIGTDAVARLVVAGDISCDERRLISNGIGAAGSQCGDAATAALATSLNPDGVLALGDIQYEAASISEINAYFNNTWGTLKSRMYPIRGNHEYITAGAAGYVEYFGAMSPSYWVTDAGGWRIIAVDSWCQGQIYAGCSATSVQTTWLNAELARADAENKCAAVLMHHPFVSSGRYATPSVESLWKASVVGGADLVMTGHDHHYERFGPLDATGAPAASGTPGTPLIISGLGGAPSYPIGAPVAGSQFSSNANHGVLSLTLTPSSYAWAFISAADNATIDSGSATCTP